MKKAVIIIYLQICFSFMSISANNLLPVSNQNYLIENKGQFSDAVRFKAVTSNQSIWINNHGFVIDQNLSRNKEFCSYDGKYYDKYPDNSKKRKPLSVEFLDSKAGSVILEEKAKYDTYFNYYIGCDSIDWIRKLYVYKSIVIKNIYEGISVKYYFDSNNLRFDFIIAPGADPNQIKIKFNNIDSLTDEKEDLVIKSVLADISLKGLKAYQPDNSINKIVECNFNFCKDILQFSLGDYDKTKVLIIDPIIYSSFIGGSDFDDFSDMEIDRSGNVYIIGSSSSSDYPYTDKNMLDTTLYIKYYRFGYITKLNHDLNGIIFSTLLSGKDNKQLGIDRITSDKNNNLYLVGSTSTNKFPLSSNALLKEKSRRIQPFAMKFDSTGTELLYSTFIYLIRSAVVSAKSDEVGNLYIIGSPDLDTIPLPITENAICKPGTNVPYGSEWPINFGIRYILKISPDGSKNLFSSYFGPHSTADTIGCRFADFAVSNNGSIILTGYTESPEYPTTASAYQSKYSGAGGSFITKINTISGKIEYSTLFNNFGAGGIQIDKYGNIIICGGSKNTTGYIIDNLPNSSGKYFTFIAKFDSTLSTLISSCSISGIAVGPISNMVLDSNQNIYFGATTEWEETQINLTENAYKKVPTDQYDLIITMINANMDRLMFCSFFGGSLWEINPHILIDSDNHLIMGGSTGSSDFFVTDAIPFHGATDTYITKFDLYPDVSVEADNLQNNIFRISPNPATNYIDISGLNSHINTTVDAIQHMHVYNSIGDLEMSFPASQAMPSRIDVSSLSPGLYFVRYGSQSAKFIIE